MSDKEFVLQTFPLAIIENFGDNFWVYISPSPNNIHSYGKLLQHTKQVAKTEEQAWKMASTNVERMNIDKSSLAEKYPHYNLIYGEGKWIIHDMAGNQIGRECQYIFEIYHSALFDLASKEYFQIKPLKTFVTMSNIKIETNNNLFQKFWVSLYDWDKNHKVTISIHTAKDEHDAINQFLGKILSDEKISLEEDDILSIRKDFKVSDVWGVGLVISER